MAKEYRVENLGRVPAIKAGPLANRPAPGAFPVDGIWEATDSPYGRFRNTGTAWVTLGGAVAAGVGSIDGVSPNTGGGNIDLVAGTNITITPDNTADTITIAASGSGTAGVGSIEGVTPSAAGGNIDLVAGTNMTITPNDGGDSITFAASGGSSTSLTTVDTIAALRAIDTTSATDYPTGTAREVMGYYAAEDSGGGLFRWRISKSFSAATNDVLTVSAHGYVQGEAVSLSGTMPTSSPQLAAGTTYYVHAPTANTLMLSTTKAGATLSFFTWVALTAVVSGALVRPVNGHYYKAGGAGRTGNVQPTWPLTAGSTVKDNAGMAAVARSTAYALGACVLKPAGTSADALFYECTTAGTTAGTAPAYPTTDGATVTDGTAVFTTRTAIVWTEQGTDPIVDITATGSGTIDLADNGGSVIAPTSGAGRWVNVRVSETLVNVRKFGAKGDEVQDDAPFFQKALDYCASKGRKTLFVPNSPAPSYLMDSTITVNGIRMVGEGPNTTLYYGRDFGAANPAIRLLDPTGGAANGHPELESLFLYGPWGNPAIGGVAPAMSGVWVGNDTDEAKAKLNKVIVQRFGNGLVWDNGAGHIVHRDVQAYNNHYGIYIKRGTADYLLDQCAISGNTFAGIGLPKDTGLIGLTASRGDYGFQPYSVYQSDINDGSTGYKMGGFLSSARWEGVNFEQVGNSVILTEASAGASFIGNTFDSCFHSWGDGHKIAARPRDYVIKVTYADNNYYRSPQDQWGTGATGWFLKTTGPGFWRIEGFHPSYAGSQNLHVQL